MKKIVFISFIISILIIEWLCYPTLMDFLKTENQLVHLKHQNGYVKYRRVVKKEKSSFSSTIIIFPPTGGENLIDRMYATRFAAHDFEVIIIQQWSGMNFEGFAYELHNEFYGSAQDALNHVLETVKSKTVGILGTSVGALHSSVAITINPKINAGFLIVGGLPIPSVIVNSKQQAMIVLKEKRYQEFNLENDLQYAEQLSQIFMYEPTQIAKDGFTSKPVGMVLSSNDLLVPTAYQKNAKNFFHADPTYTSDYDHTKTVIYTGLFKRNMVLDFFKINL